MTLETERRSLVQQVERRAGEGGASNIAAGYAVVFDSEADKRDQGDGGVTLPLNRAASGTAPLPGQLTTWFRPWGQW